MALRDRFHRALMTIGGVYMRVWPPRPARAIRRVVLLRPDGLGDVLMLTPALARLRAALPDVTFALEVGPWAMPVAQHGPEGFHIEAVAFPGMGRGPRPHPMRPYVDLWFESQHLARSGYDAAVILRPDHWWGSGVAGIGRVPHILGFDTPDVRPGLTEVVPFDPHMHSSRANLVLIERLIAKATGQPVRPLPPDDATLARQHPLVFRVPESARASAAALLCDVPPHAPLVAINPGTAAVKRWPLDRWARVADALIDRCGAAVVLTGTREEAPLTAAVAAAMTRPALDLAGRTDFPALGATFERAALVLGPDSGSLHLAVAVGTPTVHLYGPADPAKFGPWGDPARHVVLHASREEIPCLHCGDLSPERPPAPPCMVALTEAHVLAAAERLLGQER